MAIELKGTEKTPNVLMDADRGTFSFVGICMPEDASNFFQPLYKFIEVYLQKPKSSSEFNFDLEYFNTSSARLIYQIMQLLGEYSSSSSITINWYFDEDDFDLEEAGEEFKLLAEGVEFNLIKKKVNQL